MIETMRAADGAGHRGATRSASRCGSRSSRSSGQPALPVQAADPADGDRQPGDRAARRRDWSRSTRAACRCPTCAASVDAPRQRPRPLPRPRRGRARRGQARADRRHLPARGATTSTASSSSTASDPRTLTTWEQFERFHRDAFVERITGVRRAGRLVSAVERLLVRARLARRRRAPRPACWSRSRASGSRAVEPGSPRRRRRRRGSPA